MLRPPHLSAGSSQLGQQASSLPGPCLHHHRVQAESGVARSDVSLLNFVVSDGRSLIATRYVSNTDESPASLYYAEVWRGGVADKMDAHVTAACCCFWHCLASRRPGGRLPCCGSTSSAAPPPTPAHPQGSAYEREQLPNALSRKYSALAAALHDRESMEGVAGARSRPVTGELQGAQRI